MPGRDNRDADVVTQLGNYRSSPAWREQDYDDSQGPGQKRGRYADPMDQGHEPRDRWEGSGGSRWDENDRRAREIDELHGNH